MTFSTSVPVFAGVVEEGLRHPEEEEAGAHAAREKHRKPRGIVVLWHAVRLSVNGTVLRDRSGLS